MDQANILKDIQCNCGNSIDPDILANVDKAKLAKFDNDHNRKSIPQINICKRCCLKFEMDEIKQLECNHAYCIMCLKKIMRDTTVILNCKCGKKMNNKMLEEIDNDLFEEYCDNVTNVYKDN